MWDVWVWPLAVVTAIIVWISVKSVVRTRKSMQFELNEQDAPIPDAIEDHPFTLNPILWVILIATIFSFIVIFYYWASSF